MAKVTDLGYDPQIRKDYNGRVIALATPSEDPSSNMFQSAQEQHDEERAQARSKADQLKPETEEEGIRAEAIRRERVRRLAAPRESKAPPEQTPDSSM